MQVRILSDGTAAGTRVLDEDGEQLHFVTGVHLAFSRRKPPQIQLLAAVEECDIRTDEAGLFAVLDGKRYRLIEESPASGRGSKPEIRREG